MNLRRSALVEVKDGVIGSYVHNTVKPGLGKLGVLVGLESTGDKDELAALGKQIAMHIANTNPLSVVARRHRPGRAGPREGDLHRAGQGKRQAG